MIHYTGKAIVIQSEAGYVLPNNLYFAILSNTMIKSPKDEKGKIDMKNPLNQLGIIYFRDAIIGADIKNSIDFLYNLSYKEEFERNTERSIAAYTQVT